MNVNISKAILIDLLMENYTPNMRFDDILNLINKAEEETKVSSTFYKNEN